METTCFPGKRALTASSLTLVRKFNYILFVAIAAVATAALSAFLRSSLHILEKQTFTSDFRKTSHGASQIVNVFQSIPSSTDGLNVCQNSAQHEQSHSNLVFVLDFWERMINIQSGLRRLVNIGVESDFTVVEPFMYESRIHPSYSDNYHFTSQNMTPQTAMKYFQTEDLCFTNSYISHGEAMRRIEKTVGYPNETAEIVHVIHAAVYFDWPENGVQHDHRDESLNNTSFRWCDSKLSGMGGSEFGYALSRTTFIERAVCLSAHDTMSPSVITPRLFRALFRFVRNGTKSSDRRCQSCTALAFMNYRKHAFNGFQSNLRTRPFNQKVPPLEVSLFGRELGRRVRRDILRNRPYVAIQLRTGKAFTLFEKYEVGLKKAGVNITRYSSFKSWLKKCTRKISSVAKKQGRELGRMTVYYIASDMFNDGWKGGEECPPEIIKALKDAKVYLSKELRPLHRFDPKVFGIRQDVMGTSSIADAAVSRAADRFLFARPSNFGKWVAEQRELAGRGEVYQINCLDVRLMGG